MKRFLTRVIKIYFQVPMLILLLMNVFPLYSQTGDLPPDSNKTEISENDEEGDEKIEDNSESEKKLKDDDIELRTVVIKGTKLEGRKKKNIQEISRHTMTAQEMKQVPASFGDSLSAITSLPGIIRSGGGMFGPLVIRGADLISNNYFIDDIPVNDPMHLGGLHSIINTNIMDEIDIYASAFPAQFGTANAAVIDISTVDKVERFSGYSDFGLLSLTSLIQTPILKDKNGNLIFDTPAEIERNDETENAGYIIASGRYGYFGIAIKIVELFTGDDVPFTPVYWDYQFKGKYYFNRENSVTLLLFGFKDGLEALIGEEDIEEEGSDPVFSDIEFQVDKLSHNQGLYYDFKPSRKLSNRIVFFSNLTDSYFYMNFGGENVAEWAKDLNVTSRPWIFGNKDKAKMKWLADHAELRGGIGYTQYYFKSFGKTILPNKIGPVDLADPDAFAIEEFDEVIRNHLLSGYIENKFTIFGLTVVPGFRSDYLKRSLTATYDPRIMASYKFPTDTTVSIASGKYSYFFQVNPFLFDSNANICKIGKELPPEKAIHNSLGVEQEYDLYTLKIEGFYNYFYDKPYAYPHVRPDNTYYPGMSNGKMKTFGVEIMIRKDKAKNQNGLFGWVSYTYTRSIEKTGLPTEDGLYDLYYPEVDENGDPVLDDDGNPVLLPVNKAGDPWGDQWINSAFEQIHNIKLVAGYQQNRHIFSCRFQYYTSFPITPIVGIEQQELPDGTMVDYLSMNGINRYAPKYGKRNSDHLAPYYQLDVRYTFETVYSFGYVNFYVEVINAFNMQSEEYKWYWDRPYEKGKNPQKIKEEGFALLPNFGVEVKF